MPSPVGERQLGGILGDDLGEGNCESKIVSRQWRDNFCPETSRCLAGPLWEGVAERNCGHYRSGFLPLRFFFLKNEMRKLDIFQVASNVDLVAEARCRRRA